MWYRLKGDHLTELTHARTSKLKIYEGMEGTRKTISKMIKTPHLTETPRHSYKTHGPWLSYVAAYKASAWNAGVFSKFEIPMNYPEISGKKSVKLPQITKSHTIKFYKSHLITSHRKTHGKCKATEVFKWKFLTLWTFSDKCAAVYIYNDIHNVQYCNSNTCNTATPAMSRPALKVSLPGNWAWQAARPK